jgi:hypothetical protein
MRISIRVCLRTGAVVLLAIAAMVCGVGSVLNAQSGRDRPFAELRGLSAHARIGLSDSEARGVGLKLAENSFALSLIRDDMESSMPGELGNLLADHHLRWQQDKRSSIDEYKFIRSLNDRLGLNKSPEYLRFGVEQLRKVRTLIWMRVPELSTGVERRQAKPGARLIPDSMSPFEAFLAADWLLFYKSYEPEYVRTASEPVPPRPPELDKPGNHVVTPDPRCLEFRNHLQSVALTSWHGRDALVRAAAAVLEESRNDR